MDESVFLWYKGCREVFIMSPAKQRRFAYGTIITVVIYVTGFIVAAAELVFEPSTTHAHHELFQQR